MIKVKFGSNRFIFIEDSYSSSFKNQNHAQIYIHSNAAGITFRFNT